VAVALAIAIAGALGALARYGLDAAVERLGGGFPWGIFLVNVSGAFLAGLAVAWTNDRFEDVDWLRAGLLVGFLGAYTTFSTLSLDSYPLFERGAVGLALLNTVGTLTLGLLAVWAGLSLGRIL
jgi:fluoride exporter